MQVACRLTFAKRVGEGKRPVVPTWNTSERIVALARYVIRSKLSRYWVQNGDAFAAPTYAGR